MNHKKFLPIVAAAFAGGLLVPGVALGGGIGLYEIGTPDIGLASAGYAARAQDASTLFKNPAGMSLLTEPQLQTGLQLLYGSVKFNKDDADTGPDLRDDSNGGNALGALPGASLFLVYPLTEKFAVGFGTFSYFGLAENYEDNWAGRYYIQDGTLLGMSLMPTVSFKATDWLSVGAGLNAMFGYLDTKAAIRTGTPGDGQMKIKDNAWGFGANAGILIEPVKGTRFGVTYLSPVDLDFADRPSFNNLGPLGGLAVFQSPPNLDLGVTVPQSVMIGVYHELSEKWAVMADLGWQNWNEFGKVDVGVDSANPSDFTTDLEYDDTWHGAIGMQYKPTEKWQFTSGVAYDTSAVSDADRTLTLPMGETYRFGLGAIYHWKQNLEVGFAGEFAWLGDMTVVQDSTYRGRVSGSFDSAWISFFTANLTWRF